MGKQYWLVETKAPAGHSLLPQPIPFTLTSRYGDGSGTNVSMGAEMSNPLRWAKAAVQSYNSDFDNNSLNSQGMIVDGHYQASIIVVDTEMPTLPKSGGLGLYPYVALAAALIASALATRRAARTRA